jgi:hypothetical protein
MKRPKARSKSTPKGEPVTDFLNAIDVTKNKPRIQVLLESAYLRAQLGHSVALKSLLERYAEAEERDVSERIMDQVLGRK